MTAEAVASPEGLRESIRRELDQRRAQARRDPFDLLRLGDDQTALEDLVYFTRPDSFPSKVDRLAQRLEGSFLTAEAGIQRSMLQFAADLTVRLRSFLPQWNLLGERMSPEEVALVADRMADLAVRMGRQVPEVEASLLATWRGKNAARLRAESVPDAEGAAVCAVGSTVADSIESTSAAVRASNLRRVAEMRAAGATRSEVSNDYAAFLPYALLLGASFVTCNPPLVDLAWLADPDRWTPVVDRVIAARPRDGGEALARAVTLEIVLANMRLLRPIFLLSEGAMGCVSLQVNPRRHDDAGSMVADALALYDELRDRLGGGVPNVVFKLPGTFAGLETCRVLTRRAIGVTITVNFSLFQHLPFAVALQDGQALFCTLAHMSGRLAFPVRDELLANLGNLSEFGIDQRAAREAAAWSGVLVLKRLHRWMARRGVDLARVKPLIASLRVYEGDMYGNLPSPIPDITEAIGTGILTVFPNVRRAFDALPMPRLDPHPIDAPAPAHVLGVLRHSETFKQAYSLGPWAEAQDPDDPALTPRTPLSLEDRRGVSAWTPVANTLGEFCRSYDTFVDRILARREAVPEGETTPSPRVDAGDTRRARQLSARDPLR